ncbi:MAG: CoA transferase [Gracilibacteraceae bacterium]|jgi:crotonobetainyl-CoA:carnitine CoA-transferase CaiB-like acyl-CoA transferase|nr:CoA transferase [Gracilibacteraceae bacterium]
MSKRLEGIKVVELSTFLASASCGKLLAQWGADVIKIDPIYDDPYRVFGRTFLMPVTDDENICWQWAHANKKTIAVDPKLPEGREIILKLLADADIMITNFKLETLKKLKLTYDDLKDEFPRLIYGLVTGYGTKGPWKNDPGFDGIAFFARPGWQRGYGSEDLVMLPPGTVGDNITGSNLFMGLLLSLLNRQKTGKGEQVDVSLFGVSMYYTALHMVSASYYGYKLPKSKEERLPLASPYKCKDGNFVLINMISFERGWPAFCKEFGIEKYIEDPRFQTISTVRQNISDMHALFEDLFGQYDSGEMIERCLRANCPATLLGNFKDMSENVHAKEAGYLTPFTFPSGRTINLPMDYIQFTEEEPFEMKPAPLFGEHTREILTGLGYTAAQIDELIEKKATSAR